MRVAVNAFAEYSIGFGNEFYIKSMNGYNIKSSAFIVPGISTDVYISDVADIDRENGSLFLFSVPSVNSTSPTIIKRNIGIINYKKGVLTLNPINILSGKEKDGKTIIEISACPKSNDVIGLQDLYLQLDIGQSSFTTIVDEISSGLDPSASNYIVTSSYHNGVLVRSGGRDSRPTQRASTASTTSSTASTGTIAGGNTNYGTSSTTTSSTPSSGY